MGNNPPEEWRVIPNFKEYEASSLGRIRRRAGSTRCKIDRVKMAQPGSDGYEFVVLYQGGRGHGRHVNNLVCHAFHGDPPDGCNQSRHKDGNRLNNAASNLSWTDAQGNADDRRKHGTHPIGSINGFSKLAEPDIVEIRRRVGSGEKRKEVAAAFGVCTSTVDKIITGVHWNHVSAP